MPEVVLVVSGTDVVVTEPGRGAVVAVGTGRAWAPCPSMGTTLRARPGACAAFGTAHATNAAAAAHDARARERKPRTHRVRPICREGFSPSRRVFVRKLLLLAGGRERAQARVPG